MRIDVIKMVSSNFQHTSSSSQFIEGISNDLLYILFGTTVVVILIVGLLKKCRSQNDNIHPHHLEQVQEIRQQVLENRGENPEQGPHHRREADDRCPICIDLLSFAVETNCGHVFCCKIFKKFL